MAFLGEWLRRIHYLIYRRKIERELLREMETHREMMPDARGFGNSLRLREEVRDVWGWNWLDAAWGDLKYSMRSLRKTPGFAVSAVLILGLGIGVNLAFFQIVNSTLLRPLPVRDPGSLVRFDRMWKNTTVSSISSAIPYPATQFIRSNNSVLSAVLMETIAETVWSNDPTDRIRGSYVSANWFDELGATTSYGRLLHEDPDESPDAPPVVVLGEHFWTARFGRDPTVIGKTVRINDRPALVIGIAPQEFIGLKFMQQDIQVWMPINQIDYFLEGTGFKTAWSRGGPEVYGRLREGISLAAARDSLRAPMAELAAQRPADFNVGEWLEPYSGSVNFARPEDLQLLWRVMVLVAFLFILVLLIACANLSSIVLSRGLNRVRELSLRTALGAGASRILAHLLAESVWIAAIGTILGMAIGYIALTVFAARVDASAWLHWNFDWNLAFAGFFIATGSMVAVGLIPAWKIIHKRQELVAAIKDGGQQASAGLNRTRLRQMLIGLQIAGSCILLVVAGVMVRRLAIMVSDPGFEFRNVAVLNVNLERFGVKNAEARSYWTGVKQAVSSSPEIEGVSLVTSPPFGNSLTTSRYPDAREIEVIVGRVDSDFFRVMTMPILAGRTFNASDDFRSTIIISKRLALRMYGTLEVIGKGFPKSKPERTIVGVAGDARLRLNSLNAAEVYFPLNPDRMEVVSLVARVRTNPESQLPVIRQIARNANSRILPDAHTMLKDFNQKTDGHRTMSTVAVALAVLALALACLGMFGLLSYAVSLRRKEIGIRMALGARRSSIVSLVMSQLFWPALAGIIFGVAGGIVASAIIANETRFLAQADAAIAGAVVAVFLAAAGLTSLVPAIRATRTNVLHALRYE